MRCRTAIRTIESTDDIGPSQDYQQGQDYYLQHQDDEALPIVSTNDWWRLLLPNPWMEVHRTLTRLSESA